MKLPVRDVLNSRRARLTTGRKIGSLVAALAVHVFLALAFILAPMLAAGDRELPEFVAVQIVPVQMLGSSTPTPDRPRPEPRREPEPEVTEPEPEVAEPEISEPEPPPSAVPEPSSRQPEAPTPKRVEARETAPPGALSEREGSPTGSRLGTSNFGAAVGFDNPDFTYDYYVDRMLSRIREYWVRPPLGGRVEAVISFRILADGKVVDVSIAKSSGYNSFDLAAMRAVQSASPLPPLPQSFDHASLGVNLVVR